MISNKYCIDWFKELGWDYECGYDIAPDSENPKRENYKEVLIMDLNPFLIFLKPFSYRPSSYIPSF